MNVLQGPIYMTHAPLEIKAVPLDPKYPHEEVSFQTKNPPRSDLPTEEQLKPSAQKALKAFDDFWHSSDGATFRAGKWNVAAVPVRASHQECIDCHRGFTYWERLRLGDTLGVAMYAYAPASQSAKTQAAKGKSK